MSVVAGGSGDYTYRVLSIAPTSNLATNAITITEQRVVSLSAAPAVGIVTVAIEADDGFTRATTDLALQVSVQLEFSPSNASIIVHSSQTGNIYNALASLGLPPYRYTLAGALPASATAQVSVSAAGGVSLPQALGVSQSISIYIAASDGFSSTATLTLQIETGEVHFTDGILTLTLSERTSGAVYTVQAGGAASPLSYRFLGTLANVALDSEGLLSVTSPFGAAQVVSMTVEARDDYSNALQTVVLDVLEGVTLSLLNTIGVHRSYTGTVAAAVVSLGGGGYRYTLNALVPADSAVVIDSSSGVIEITGTLQVGSISLQIEVADNLGDTVSASLIIEVFPDVVLPDQNIEISHMGIGHLVTITNVLGGDGTYHYQMLSVSDSRITAQAVANALIIGISTTIGVTQTITARISVTDGIAHTNANDIQSIGGADDAQLIIVSTPASIRLVGGTTDGTETDFSQTITVVRAEPYVSSGAEQVTFHMTVNAPISLSFVLGGFAGSFNNPEIDVSSLLTLTQTDNDSAVVNYSELVKASTRIPDISYSFISASGGGGYADFVWFIAMISPITLADPPLLTVVQNSIPVSNLITLTASGGSGQQDGDLFTHGLSAYSYQLLSSVPPDALSHLQLADAYDEFPALFCSGCVVQLTQAYENRTDITVWVEATDNHSRHTAVLSMRVIPRHVTVSVVSEVTVHQSYRGTVAAAVAALGYGDYRYAIADITPADSAVAIDSSSGVVEITGTLQAGTVLLQIEVTDGVNTANVPLTIRVLPDVTLPERYLYVNAGQSGNLLTINNASGGDGTYHYQMLFASDNRLAAQVIPNGLILSIPTAIGADQAITARIRATDDIAQTNANNIQSIGGSGEATVVIAAEPVNASYVGGLPSGAINIAKTESFATDGSAIFTVHMTVDAPVSLAFSVFQVGWRYLGIPDEELFRFTPLDNYGHSARLDMTRLAEAITPLSGTAPFRIDVTGHGGVVRIIRNVGVYDPLNLTNPPVATVVQNNIYATHIMTVQAPGGGLIDKKNYQLSTAPPDAVNHLDTISGTDIPSDVRSCTRCVIVRLTQGYEEVTNITVWVEVSDDSPARETAVFTIQVLPQLTLSSNVSKVTVHNAYRGTVATVQGALGIGSYSYSIGDTVPANSPVTVDANGVVAVIGDLQTGDVLVEVEVTDDGATVSIPLTIHTLPPANISYLGGLPSRAINIAKTESFATDGSALFTIYMLVDPPITLAFSVFQVSYRYLGIPDEELFKFTPLNNDTAILDMTRLVDAVTPPTGRVPIRIDVTGHGGVARINRDVVIYNPLNLTYPPVATVAQNKIVATHILTVQTPGGGILDKKNYQLSTAPPDAVNHLDTISGADLPSSLADCRRCVVVRLTQAYEEVTNITVWVEVSDDSPARETAVFTIQVVPQFTVSPAALVTVEQSYRGVVATVQESLESGDSYGYALSSIVPAGSPVSINSSGVVRINGALQLGQVSLQIEVREGSDTTIVPLVIQVVPDDS